MAAVANPPTSIVERAELRNVSWDTYDRLLADDPDRNLPRLTYDRGVLEIVSPSPEHEQDADALKLIVVIVSAALSVPVAWFGATTFRRPDLQQGFEADGSYYVQHEPRMRGRRQIDLLVDPPPDLVIEVDVSRSSRTKLLMFAEMGVPEVWRSDGGRVAILALTGGVYQESEASVAVPSLTAAVLTRFLNESRTLPSTEWFRAVSRWAAEQQDGGQA